MGKRSPRNISNSILMFNRISKLFGFAVINPNVTFVHRLFREILLLSYLFISTGCSIRSEIWCLFVLKIVFVGKKLIVFLITQVLIVSTFSCLFFHRLNNNKIWNIITQFRLLEDRLITCNINLEVAIVEFYGLTFPFVHLFSILSVMYYIVSFYRFNLLIDSTCVFYFDAWVAVPCLQFVGWISLLSYVVNCIQCRIAQLNELNWSVQHWNEFRSKKLNNDDYVVKIRRLIVILVQIMEIATESAAAYGVMVLIFLLNYFSRVVVQLYDIMRDDGHTFPVGAGIWHVIVRMVFILPIFISGESFTHNVNKTVQMVLKTTLRRHPSKLNIVYRRLAFRLYHKAPIIRVCGVLNITYRSFLKIMTISITFLVLQLQSMC